MLGFIDHNIVQYVKLLIYYIVKLDTYILLGIILFYILHVVVGGFHFSIDFIESMTNQCMDRNPVSRDLFIAVKLYSDEIGSSLSLDFARWR